MTNHPRPTDFCQYPLKKIAFVCSNLKSCFPELDKKCPELVNFRKRIIFHQDNARLHVSLMTRQKLLQVGCKVWCHPPYSPDIAPVDFHLFQSLQNSCNGNGNSMEKISIPCKTVKGTWNSSLLKKLKNFGKMELRSCLKNGRR